MEIQGGQIIEHAFDFNTGELAAAHRRAEVLGGSIDKENKAELIDNYLARLQFILNNETPAKTERARRLLRSMLQEKYIASRDEVLEYYLHIEQRMHRERGFGGFDITDQIRELSRSGYDEIITEAITTQTESLDNWFEYLTSEDSQELYPNWFRYWVFRNILNLLPYERHLGKFPVRDGSLEKHVFTPYPELDRGALGLVLDDVLQLMDTEGLPDFSSVETLRKDISILENRKSRLSQVLHFRFNGINPNEVRDQKLKRALESDDRSISELEKAIDDLDQQLAPLKMTLGKLKKLQNLDFATMYASHTEAGVSLNEQLLETTEGKWVIFKEGTHPRTDVGQVDGTNQTYARSLLDSLTYSKTNFGLKTGWCTEGEAIATHQLNMGDFYIYFTNDPNGEPTIPRIAIRKESGRVDEVRGIAENQNLDPKVEEIAELKLSTFPDANVYRKRVADMKLLTSIEKRKVEGKPLRGSDLVFLYEIFDKIDGFGYGRDPRIKDLLKDRDQAEDLTMIHEYLGETSDTLPASIRNARYLLSLKQKIDTDTPFSANDLVFLYEVEETIHYPRSFADLLSDVKENALHNRDLTVDVFKIYDELKSMDQPIPKGISDVRHLLLIENKADEELTIDDLLFLYEVESTVYIPTSFTSITKTIQESRLSKRDVEKDMETFYEYFQSQEKRLPKVLHDIKRLTELKPLEIDDEYPNEDDEYTIDYSVEDLVFLYQLDEKIQIPRWLQTKYGHLRASLLKHTDLDFDISIMFNCDDDEIARHESQVNNDTKVYIGPLYPGIFQDLNKGQRIFTWFSSSSVRECQRETLNMNEQLNLLDLLAQQDILITPHAEMTVERLVRNNYDQDFTRIEPAENNIVILGAQDLFNGYGKLTVSMVLEKARDLGLKTCHEHLLTSYLQQHPHGTISDYFFVSMKPVNLEMVRSVLLVGFTTEGNIVLDSRAMDLEDSIPTDLRFAFCY